MKLESNRLLHLIVYITCICLYTVGIVIVYNLLYRLHYYYLFITIPVLFLLVILTIVNFLKSLFLIILMVFGRNDNSEINHSIVRAFNYINRTCKYTLIGIFLTLLSSIMLLDIMLCIRGELYILMSLSIVVWILMYYFTFWIIVKLIKKEIRV